MMTGGGTRIEKDAPGIKIRKRVRIIREEGIESPGNQDSKDNPDSKDSKDNQDSIETTSGATSNRKKEKNPMSLSNASKSKTTKTF